MTSDLQDKTGAVLSMLGASAPPGLTDAQRANYALMAANRVAGVAPDVTQEQHNDGRASYSIGFGGHTVLTVTKDEKGQENIFYNGQEPPAGHMNKAIGHAEAAQAAGTKYNPDTVYEEKPAILGVSSTVSQRQQSNSNGFRAEETVRSSQVNLSF